MDQHLPDMMKLWRRFAEKKATPAELDELFAYLEQDENDKAFLPLIEEYLRQPIAAGETDREYWLARLKEIIPGTVEAPAIVKPLQSRGKWWMAAASIALLFGLAAYFIFFNKTSQPDKPVIAREVEAPKSIKAVITLADGRNIAVDSLTTLNQNNVVITKTAGGQITYQYEDGTVIPSGGEVAYNTLTNPRGSKVIDMTLSDGSHVWLNAGSSITYPVMFTGDERKVSMTGEAYFEVTHNATAGGAKLSFIVEKGDMQVTVLGTHFNVSAYDDESNIRVTLLEGSVKTSNSFGDVMLRPGQQATITKNQKPETRNNIDLDQVMAWKNGLFSFSNADVREVMRQVARWYDVEVVYAGAGPQGRFKGEIPRDLTLTQLLNGLSSTRLHFKVEDRRITILPD